ncbi:hypothetical protein T492DRAFT_869406 [Pavlovales sp. CCMP2436]|nr:hypothetical protein T492DRAFT_869406 [Pavlovales sp. CCMP2436]
MHISILALFGIDSMEHIIKGLIEKDPALMLAPTVGLAQPPLKGAWGAAARGTGGAARACALDELDKPDDSEERSAEHSSSPRSMDFAEREGDEQEGKHAAAAAEAEHPEGEGEAEAEGEGEAEAEGEGEGEGEYDEEYGEEDYGEEGEGEYDGEEEGYEGYGEEDAEGEARRADAAADDGWGADPALVDGSEAVADGWGAEEIDEQAEQTGLGEEDGGGGGKTL